MKEYDVFISHKSDCKQWVKTLAENLKGEGIDVFLDIWELVPGSSIVDGLYRGLKGARKGIIVVTPEAFESGWVREEYSQMMMQKQERSDFSIIPVVLGHDVPDFPFMKDILWIDFREPGEYRSAFYRLFCAVRGESPGSEIRLKKEPRPPQQLAPEEQPGRDDISFVEELLESFHGVQAIMLLAPEGMRRRGVKTRLLERAGDIYGSGNVYHMVPPLGGGVDMEDYFAILAGQCGFGGEVKGKVDFIRAIESLMQGDGRVFLAVSGFENSCKEGQEELAGVLRNMSERFPNRLRILLCGGEKLADLYYGGTLSYLNNAEARPWPEPTVNDVCRMADGFNNGLRPDEEAAQRLLQLSGGHPEVLRVCFQLLRRNGDFTMDELVAELLRMPVIWQAFTPFLADEGMKPELCRLLEANVVGPDQPYIYNPLLKRLYWRNLLRRATGVHKLCWRCEVLRLAGQKILCCGAKGESSHE